MKILAVDDEEYALRDLESTLYQIVSKHDVTGVMLACEALRLAKEQSFDVAFLDIEMGSMNGLTLAIKLKELQPNIHIIFVTSYEKYALDAFSVHATGYLLKPVALEDIRRELTFLYGDNIASNSKISVQTFGGFEVYTDNQPVFFKRAKSKELLAYLVDRRGAGITTREACNILFEDGQYNTTRKNYFQTIVSDLRTDLKVAGIEHILLRKRNSLSVDTSTFTCDYYQFLEGNPIALNQYRHDYLPSYSWAEFTIGELDKDY